MPTNKSSYEIEGEKNENKTRVPPWSCSPNPHSKFVRPSNNWERRIYFYIFEIFFWRMVQWLGQWQHMLSCQRQGVCVLNGNKRRNKKTEITTHHHDVSIPTFWRNVANSEVSQWSSWVHPVSPRDESCSKEGDCTKGVSRVFMLTKVTLCQWAFNIDVCGGLAMFLKLLMCIDTSTY